MEDPVKLLIVDDDEAIRSFFSEIFQEEEIQVECVSNGEEAIEQFNLTTYDVVVTDLCMPRMDGIRVIQEIQKLDPAAVIVAITGFGTIKDAVSLMKTGAYDVLTKPFSLDEIKLTIDKAIRHHRLAKRNRELELKLKTTERLAAIGKLAAGVAHEINNPLDGAIRFVNLSLDNMNEPGPVREYLEDARAGLDRIAGIVRSLLNFSRSIVLESDPQPLGDLVRESLNTFHNLMKSRKVNIRLDFEDVHVQIPGGYVHVFANLTKNALDEMPDGGELCIRSRAIDNHLEVKFSDTGPGIPESIQDKIFEPFFTTKKMGSGTGLGLSICQQIIEKQGGSIKLDSQVGKGTTFTISIPEEASFPMIPELEIDGGPGMEDRREPMEAGRS